MVDLIWTVEHPHLSLRCKPWRAPTSSWASVISSKGTPEGSHVRYWYTNKLQQGIDLDARGKRTDFYATLIATKCSAQGNDPTSRLLSAYIILKEPLVKSRVCRTDSDAGWHVAKGENSDLGEFYEDFNSPMIQSKGPKRVTRCSA